MVAKREDESIRIFGLQSSEPRTLGCTVPKMPNLPPQGASTFYQRELRWAEQGLSLGFRDSRKTPDETLTLFQIIILINIL